MYITKATDLWSYWIICWKTIVNHYDFYSLNLWNILSGGLGWSSPTVNVRRLCVVVYSLISAAKVCDCLISAWCRQVCDVLFKCGLISPK